MHSFFPGTHALARVLLDQGQLLRRHTPRCHATSTHHTRRERWLGTGYTVQLACFAQRFRFAQHSARTEGALKETKNKTWFENNDTRTLPYETSEPLDFSQGGGSEETVGAIPCPMREEGIAGATTLLATSHGFHV